MEQVTKQIWIGDISDVLVDCELVKNNINAIINVANEVVVDIQNNDIQEFKFGFKDSEFNDKKIVKLCLDLIQKLVNEDKKNVLILCACGVNRSPAIIAEFLTKFGFMYYDDAIKLVKKVRNQVNDNFRLYDRKKEGHTLGDVLKHD